jgi:hypothetical protein
MEIERMNSSSYGLAIRGVEKAGQIGEKPLVQIPRAALAYAVINSRILLSFATPCHQQGRSFQQTMLTGTDGDKRCPAKPRIL